MADFNKAITPLLAKEGGAKVTDIGEDKGGLTKYGISKRAYPNIDIANLTEDEAKAIYKRDYWDALKLDEVSNQEVASVVLEAGVNFGVRTVSRLVQRLVGAAEDGYIGAKSVQAINEFDTTLFIVGFKLIAIDRYRQICNNDRSQTKFLLGWLNRVLG